jgi:hypothetical protein
VINPELPIYVPTKSIDLSESKCLPELWHVQITKGGHWCGWYQFFHCNADVARIEAARIRAELPWAEVHVGRYLLAAVETTSNGD